MLKKKVRIFVLGISICFFSCSEESLPKPKGQLRLEYPKAEYVQFQGNCPYNFEHSVHTRVLQREDCWVNISYPKMKAKIHLTYQPVKGDLAEKIKESERLAHEHSVKASFISPQVFEYPEKKVYGTLFELGGESAVNFQFHATDSLNHLLSGSVYFSAPPNTDSLVPAVNYIKKDVQHLMETIRWK